MLTPQSWRGDNALKLPADSHKTSAGIMPVPGFFEMWLRGKAAALMGPRAEELWQASIRQESSSCSKGLSQRTTGQSEREHATDFVPSRFSLDDFTCAESKATPVARSSTTRARSQHENPVAAAWHSVAWTVACSEVSSRYGENPRIELAVHEGKTCSGVYSMHDLYVYLFCGLEQNSEPEQWRNVVTALHDAVHEKLPKSTQCDVCTGSRLRQDKRWENTDWNFNAVRLLWTVVVSTIDKHGVGWSAWRSMDASTTQQPLPPTLQLENIPRDQLQELPGGIFKWGRYQTEPGAMRWSE